MLLVGCFLPLGCGGGQQRLVSVKLTGGTGTQKVACFSFQRGKMLAGIRAKEAADAGKDCYEFLVFDGELLGVELSGEATRVIRFPYVLRGDEKMPLVFSRRPGLALLNGEVICVDLGTKAGAEWFSRQDDAELKTIRTLLLGGGAAACAAALHRMPRSNITVALSSNSENGSTDPDTTADIAEARRTLIAAKPVCLFTNKKGVGKDTIAQLSDLTHLMITSQEMPDLTKLKKLRFLGYFDEVTTLAPLARLTRLEGLVLMECDSVTDFTPLRKLKRLRTLYIQEAEELTDLDAFADMRNLRSLVFFGKDSKISSIAPIAKLTNLTELALVPIPPAVKDLSPLKKLKNLKMLVVDDDSLEQRPEEYDEIRKALPECKVVGFCMGSAWILMVVPAAVGLGLWWRRRAAAVKVA